MLNKKGLLFGLFFISGACGLVYEVIWTRMMTLIFGVTVYAVSSVLCSFMLGLALGSLFFGRVADRTRRPLRVYAMLELGIGLFALAFPHLLEAVKPLFVHIYRTSFVNYHLFSLERLLIILPLMLGPTFLMGGTLPILSRYFLREQRHFARDLGFLYAINTAGAVIGTFLVGFVMLAWLGIGKSIVAAATVNVLVAAMALLLDRLAPLGMIGPAAKPAADAPSTGEPVATGPFAIGAPQARVVMAAIALSGFASLGLEVLWTRLLVFHTHNSTYAFSAMLLVFLLGLALGGWLLGLLAPHIRRPVALFAVLETGIGLWAIFSMLLNNYLLRLDDLLLRVIPFNDWHKAIAVILIQASVMLLVPTILMGMTFPLATRLVTSHLREVGRKVGGVYAANTFGTVAGSLLVGFFFIPLLGVRNSFLSIAAVNLLVATGLWLNATPLARLPRWAGAMASVLLIAGCVTAVPRDVLLRIYTRTLGRVVFYCEEVTDTIMVVDFKDGKGQPNKGLRWLVFSDGRGTAGHLTQQENHYVAHLPMLLHKDPKNVVVICVGSGNTIGAFKQYHCLESIDCVDLSAGIFEASHYFETNDNVFKPPVDPRIKLHVEDGRSFLLGTPRKFDVIQLEPPEMHTAGVVFLYTRDFYELCRQRLKPGGILMQWINAWKLTAEETRTCIATFHQVFPHGTVWQSPVLGHLFFVGSEEPLRVPLRQIEERLRQEPDVYRQLTADTMEDPVRFMSLLLMNEHTLDRYSAGSPVCTDDKTIIDYTSPKSVYSGYGLVHLFSPIRWDAARQGDTPSTTTYQDGGWSNIARLTVQTDSTEPFIDWTGLDDAARARGRAELAKCMTQRRQIGQELVSGVIPSSPHDMRAHWLGSLMRPSPNPRLVYTLEPELTGVYEGTPLKLNKLGLRDDDFLLEKPAGQLRVLALGDAATFGLGVDAGQSYPALLQAALDRAAGDAAKIQVVNMGVPGYNAVQKVELFKERGLTLTPDAVVLQLDPEDASVPPFIARSNYFQRRELAGGLLSDIFTTALMGGDLLRWRDAGLRTVTGGPATAPVSPAEVPEPYRPLAGLAPFESAIGELVRLCAEKKIPAYALFMPKQEQDSTASKTNETRQRLAEICARTNLRVIDAGEVATNAAGSPKPNGTRHNVTQQILLAKTMLPILAQDLLASRLDTATSTGLSSVIACINERANDKMTTPTLAISH